MHSSPDRGSWAWLPRGFAKTRWSLIRRAGKQPQPEQDAAAEVCRIYWQPMYAVLRKNGYGPEDSQDYVQSFLARMLEKGWLAQADENRGSFRKYILKLLIRHVSAERSRAGAKKRGGGTTRVPIDWAAAETSLVDTGSVDSLSPDDVFRRALALQIFDVALADLRAYYTQRGNAKELEELLPALEGVLETESYADVAERLEKTPTAVKTSAHRMRERFRASLITAASTALRIPKGPQLDDELRQVFG